MLKVRPHLMGHFQVLTGHKKDDQLHLKPFLKSHEDRFCLSKPSYRVPAEALHAQVSRTPSVPSKNQQKGHAQAAASQDQQFGRWEDVTFVHPSSFPSFHACDRHIPAQLSHLVQAAALFKPALC